GSATEYGGGGKCLGQGGVEFGGGLEHWHSSSGDPPRDGDGNGNGNGKDEDKGVSMSRAGNRLVKKHNHCQGGSGAGDEGETGFGDKCNPDGPGAPNGTKGGHKPCKE
ncbi:hypothetical protein FRC11_003710, partial [Ceratobasidium sp. 423]